MRQFQRFVCPAGPYLKKAMIEVGSQLPVTKKKR